MVSSGDFQGFQAVRVMTGRIVEWNDAKGFGWTEAEGKRVFVHVKEFVALDRRPQAGDEIRFTLEADPQGRPRAGKVSHVRTGGRIGIGAWLLWGTLLPLPGLASLLLPWPPWWVFGAAALASVVTWLMYSHDKSCAREGARRIPERTLHLCELLGGWPAAFLAQRLIRHKCSKWSYQFVFWCIVLLHQIAAVDVISGHELSRMVWRSLADR
jgi:uncharacterized membrane protein YsdA (DUF1294 family)/cold shock CspA family protein